MSKHKLNIHYRGSPWGSRTQQHAYCLRYAHSQHIESHLGKKQPQAKIPIAFLFSQLHFNNVTSHALFYGGHLVMCSKRCTVQNQGITLRSKYSQTLGNQLSKSHNLYSWWSADVVRRKLMLVTHGTKRVISQTLPNQSSKKGNFRPIPVPSFIYFTWNTYTSWLCHMM